MTDTQHTPGPWRINDTIHKDQPHIVSELGSFIADTDMHNARLIAAAPELLDALRGLLDLEPPLLSAKERKAYAIARAAIAKATGA